MAQPLAGEFDGQKRPASAWLWWVIAGGLAGVVVALTAGIMVVRQLPATYRAAIASDAPAVAESAARRMVSKVAALHAAASRAGRWEAVIQEREVNAWLAVDLPLNHRDLLPGGVEQPRVSFQPHRLTVAARLRVGPFSAVAWGELEVWLQGVNQIGLKTVAAGLGGLPVPRNAMLRHLAGRLAAAGLVTDLRRTEAGLLLVVSPSCTYDAPGGAFRLESLAFTAGELLVAGSTQRPAQEADVP